MLSATRLLSTWRSASVGVKIIDRSADPVHDPVARRPPLPGAIHNEQFCNSRPPPSPYPVSRVDRQPARRRHHYGSESYCNSHAIARPHREMPLSDRRRAGAHGRRHEAPPEVRTLCAVLHDTGCRESELLEVSPAARGHGWRLLIYQTQRSIAVKESLAPEVVL